MEPITADQIKGLKTREGGADVSEGEVKAAVEYRTEHGIGNTAYAATLSTELSGVTMLKFVEAEDHTWNCTLWQGDGEAEPAVIPVPQEEMQKIFENNQISLG